MQPGGAAPAARSQFSINTREAYSRHWWWHGKRAGRVTVTHMAHTASMWNIVSSGGAEALRMLCPCSLAVLPGWKAILLSCLVTPLIS